MAWESDITASTLRGILEICLFACSVNKPRAVKPLGRFHSWILSFTQDSPAFSTKTARSWMSNLLCHQFLNIKQFFWQFVHVTPFWTKSSCRVESSFWKLFPSSHLKHAASWKVLFSPELIHQRNARTSKLSRTRQKRLFCKINLNVKIYSTWIFILIFEREILFIRNKA